MTRNTEAGKAYLMRGWDLEKRVKAREDQLDVLRDRMQRVRSAASSMSAAAAPSRSPSVRYMAPVSR